MSYRLALRMPRRRRAGRPSVLIRDVDPAVLAVLSAQAAAAGRSLQEYLRAELARLAGRPTSAEPLERIERPPPGDDRR